MADQKLTDRSSLETSSASSLIHVVDNGTSYNQTKANFLKDVKGYAGDIDVSAIWTSGLSFDVTADSYIVNNTQYSSTSGTVTLDTADATLDRIDLIVAVAPVSPATVGTVGKISGTPASPTVVTPPDHDPSLVYVIKQVLIKAAASTPFETSNTQVFDEDVEWTTSFNSGNISVTATDPQTGTVSIEATNNIFSDTSSFTAPSAVNTQDVDLLTFWIKLKESTDNAIIAIRFWLGTSVVGTTKYFLVPEPTSTVYQFIKLNKSDFNLPSGTFDKIDIQLNNSTLGYFLDNIVIHQGSGIDPSNLISQWYNDVGYVTEGFDEFIESTGTRAVGDLVVTIGDYDDSNNGTQIQLGDEDGSITLKGSTTQISTNSFGANLKTTNLTGFTQIEFPDADGTLALTSDLTSFGNVTKVGTPVNNQIGVWTGDGTIEGDANLTIASDADTMAIVLGSDDTIQGGITLYGNATSGGGFVNFFNSTSNDTNANHYVVSADTNFKIGKSGGGSYAFEIDDLNLGLTAPASTIADIDANGIKALITKEYADANYGGDYVDLTSLQSITGTKTFDNPRVSSTGQLVMLHRTGAGASVNAINLNANNENFIIINNDAGNSQTLKINLGDITIGSQVTLTAPDTSGTIALTSDLGDYVDLTSAQAITGTKTIDNLVIDNLVNITSNGYIKMEHDTGFSSGSNAISLNSNENLFIITDNDGTTTRTVKLDLGDLSGTVTQSFTDAQGVIPLIKSTVPTSATDTGVVGQIAYNSSYFYVCTATNTWVRTALATW